MGRVLTNNVELSYTFETSLGVAGTTWFKAEPNDISTFGADITKVARNPISQDRQRRKGTTTDLDSSVEFEADLTMSSMRDFIEGFCFATGINTNATQLASTTVTDGAAGDDSYDGMTALTAAQAAIFDADTLIWVNGMATAANNGLHVIATGATAADTGLLVGTGTLAAETGATAQISLAGYRAPAADTVTWTWASPYGTLNATGLATAIQAAGLVVGQMVHIGSIASLAGAIQNGFENATANDMYGYARVSSFTDADNVVFDKCDTALQFTDGTDPATAVDICFGEFIRNVPVSDSEFLERSFQFEAAMPNLGDGTGGNTDEAYQYAKGNFCNSAAFNLPLTNKATVTFGFIGTDTDNPTTTRKSGASVATAPTQTGALNTSSDIARLRVTEADEDGITTDFKSLTLTLNNNVSPEKVLGTLGAAYVNTGNFEVDIEASMLFSNPLVINKIRDNETVTMDFVVKNDDGVIAVDVPSMTLGGGGLELPVNESVIINSTGEAFNDATLGTSVGISLIPVPFA
jgi:hypothetical protein